MDGCPAIDFVVCKKPVNLNNKAVALAWRVNLSSQFSTK